MSCCGEQRIKSTCSPMGRTMVECLRRDSHIVCTDAPQNTMDTNVEKMMPAPYSQQTAGNEYRITCALKVLSVRAFGQPTTRNTRLRK